MSADLVLRLASQVGQPVGNLRLRTVNILNTPVVGTPTWLDSGVAIADVYTLTVTEKDGSTVTVTVDCNTKNPYRNMTGVTGTADGTTVNRNLPPGVGTILSASCDVGWQWKTSIGAYMDVSGVTTDVLNFGVVESGFYTTGVRIACENVGDSPAQSTVLYSLPGLYFYGTSYDVLIKTIKPHSSPTRHKMAPQGTLTITFQDWKTGGTGKKTADVYVNASKAIEDAIFDGATVYEYGSGNGYNDGADLLQGLQIILADTTTDPSAITLTLKVADGWNWVEFAVDTSGSPGTYSNQDLTLTESGQPTGTITASHAAFFWARWKLPGAAEAGDMRKMIQRARGLTT